MLVKETVHVSPSSVLPASASCFIFLPGGQSSLEDVVTQHSNTTLHGLFSESSCSVSFFSISESEMRLFKLLPSCESMLSIACLPSFELFSRCRILLRFLWCAHVVFVAVQRRVTRESVSSFTSQAIWKQMEYACKYIAVCVSS